MFCNIFYLDKAYYTSMEVANYAQSLVVCAPTLTTEGRSYQICCSPLSPESRDSFFRTGALD